MGGDLAVALIVFAGSACVVVFCGAKLAVYGDVLATLTGWGRLFVGSLLMAFATSLPELSANVSAVRLDPPNPELALGDILGSNMLNIFILAAVALGFGAKRFLVSVAPEQGYLIVAASVLTGLALLLGGLGISVSLWEVGLSSVVLIVVFIIGMWVVYKTRPQDGNEYDSEPLMGLGRAWALFGLVAAGVLVSGFFLAWSADQIAEITGIASSTLGILLMAVVTSMPEISSTIAAARMGAADLGVAGLYGSCAFNISILFFSDIFFRDGIVVNHMQSGHFVAGGVAVGMMLLGLALVLAHRRLRQVVAAVVLGLMAGVYVAGAVIVAIIGASEHQSESGERSELSGSSIHME
ncbi:MAG: hypothetical protein VYC59_08780 [Chloroflexota bacterium]|nr:hypothetical protein [Chloroflexota bacterium]